MYPTLTDPYPSLTGEEWEIETEKAGHDATVHLAEKGYCPGCHGPLVGIPRDVLRRVLRLMLVSSDARVYAVACDLHALDMTGV